MATYSDEQRAEMARTGVALPDGSYPIPDKAALSDAVQAFGRASNPGAAKAHIIKRARALDAVDMLPDAWGVKNAAPVWETKAFELEVKDIDEATPGRFKGLLSVFGNKDLGDDIVEPGAFRKTVQENGGRGFPLLWAHDANRPLGLFKSDGESDEGLPIDAQLNMKVQDAVEKHALLKQGALKGLSMGYRTIKREMRGAVRHLQEVGLKEGSLCVFPMNELAGVTDVKAAELIAELKAGRTLSAASVAQVRAAIETLEALLGIVEPGTQAAEESALTPPAAGAAVGKVEPADLATLFARYDHKVKEMVRV